MQDLLYVHDLPRKGKHKYSGLLLLGKDCEGEP
jgi:hypothetical protein